MLSTLAAASMLCVLARDASGEERTAEIASTPGQVVTVRGDFPSLAGVVEDLCRKAGVELRGYEAGDRAVRVRYDAVPLPDALAGLLRQESYLVGVTAGDGDAPIRVSWVRVVAGPTGGSAAKTAEAEPSPARSKLPVMSFEVPATFGAAEFTSEDPEQRARALKAVAGRLLTNPGLLAADPAALAPALAAYPHARELLTQLRAEQEDPELRGRLDALIAALP
jgi:hypothetical protein